MQEEIALQSENSNWKRSYLILFIVILGSLSAFGPLTIDMYLPALPILAGDLQTSASMAQLSLTACLVGLALGQVIVGPISDIQGRKKPLMISLVIFTVASILCVFTHSIAALVALRLVQGLSGAAGMVISRASLRDTFSGTELTKYFAFLMLVNGLAPIMAPVIGGQLLAFMSWRGVFGVLAGIGFVMLLSVGIGLHETLSPEKRKTGGLKEVFTTYQSLLRDSEFVGYITTQSFVMGAMFAYISGSTFVLQEVYHLSPQAFSYIFAWNGIGIILATQMTGKLAGKVSLTFLLTIGLAIALTGSILLLVGAMINAHVVFICSMLFLIVSSVGVVNTTVFSLAMENQEEQAGSASALLGLLPFLIGAAVAPLVGIGNAAMSMAIVIVCCELLAVLCYIILIKRRG